MATREQIETIANACIEANEEIKKYGIPEMQSIMLILLLHVGQELAQQLSEDRKVIHGPWVKRPEQAVQTR